jgi:hypothetical protein
MLRPKNLMSPFNDTPIRGFVRTDTQNDLKDVPIGWKKIYMPKEEKDIAYKDVIRFHEFGYNPNKQYREIESNKEGFKRNLLQGYYNADDEYEKIRNLGGQVVYRVDELTDEVVDKNSMNEVSEKLSRLNKFRKRLDGMDIDPETKKQLQNNLISQYQEFLVAHPKIKDPDTGQEIESSSYILNLLRPFEDGQAVINRTDGEVLSLPKSKNKGLSPPMAPPMAPPIVPKAPPMTVKKENELLKTPIKTEKKKSQESDMETVFKQLLSGVKLKKAPPKTEQKESLVKPVKGIDEKMVNLMAKRRKQIEIKEDDEWDDEEMENKADKFRKRKEEERKKKNVKDAVKVLKEEFKKRKSEKKEYQKPDLRNVATRRGSQINEDDMNNSFLTEAMNEGIKEIKSNRATRNLQRYASKLKKNEGKDTPFDYLKPMTNISWDEKQNAFKVRKMKNGRPVINETIKVENLEKKNVLKAYKKAIDKLYPPNKYESDD